MEEMFSNGMARWDDDDGPLDLSVRKGPEATAKRVKREDSPDAKRAKITKKSDNDDDDDDDDDIFPAVFRPSVVVRSPTTTITTAAATTVTASVPADQTAMPSKPLPDRFAAAITPPPDDGRSATGRPQTSSAFQTGGYPNVFAEYNPFLVTDRSPLFQQRPLPPGHHLRVPQDQLHYLREQQYTMNLLEQLQQQQQQQQPFGYGNTHHHHHHFPYNLTTAMMLAQRMTAPVFESSSSSSPLQPPPLSQQQQQQQQQQPSSSNEYNPFLSGFGYNCLPRAAYNFGFHPYFGGLFGTDFEGGFGGFGDMGGIGDGGPSCDDSASLSGCSGGRSDCQSPESTTTTADLRHRYRAELRQQRHDDHLHRHRAMRMRSSAPDVPDLDTVEPDEIAAIYRQSDFVSFRQRYMDSLGPPRNFEKMRRSIPNKKIGGLGQQQYDQTYVVKRQKNNEAAKKSRDAKRQKYIENQISVMYLTKKVSEMKEIKRRLLLSM